MKKNYNFTPWWISGFTQADGSFIVIIAQHPRRKFGSGFKPVFELSQSIVDLDMMKALHSYLKVGKLQISRNAVSIVVSSRKEILTTIIPHFDKYPLQGGKLQSYFIFRQAVINLEKNTVSTLEGFIGIVEMCYFINSTSTRTVDMKNKIMAAAVEKARRKPNNIPVIYIDKSIDKNQSINKDFVAGIIDGDGSIVIGFGKNITAAISVTISTSDYDILVSLEEYFGCGKLQIVKNKKAAVFVIYKLQDLINTVKPFFYSVHLNTVKSTYLEPHFKAWELLAKKPEDYKTKVANLVYNINQKGKNRKIPLETYLETIKLDDIN